MESSIGYNYSSQDVTTYVPTYFLNTKQCGNCRKVLSLNEFRTYRGNLNGSCNYCLDSKKRDTNIIDPIIISQDKRQCNKCRHLLPLNNFRFYRAKLNKRCNRCIDGVEKHNLDTGNSRVLPTNAVSLNILPTNTLFLNIPPSNIILPMNTTFPNILPLTTSISCSRCRRVQSEDNFRKTGKNIRIKMCNTCCEDGKRSRELKPKIIPVITAADMESFCSTCKLVLPKDEFRVSRKTQTLGKTCISCLERRIACRKGIILDPIVQLCRGCKQILPGINFNLSWEGKLQETCNGCLSNYRNNRNYTPDFVDPLARSCIRCYKILPQDNFRMNNKGILNLSCNTCRDHENFLQHFIPPVTFDGGRVCTRCKKESLEIDNFRMKTNGEFNSTCNQCLDSCKCIHGTQKNYCVACFGVSMCVHGIRKRCCRPCGGKGYCIHNKWKYMCRICNPDAYCSHNTLRNSCRPCGGSLLCFHGFQPFHCRRCANEQCLHSIPRRTCEHCRGTAWCIHSKYKADCVDCMGTNVCSHRKRRDRCHDCHGSSFCQHDRRKNRCKLCFGSSVCIHNKQKDDCQICNPIGYLKRVVSSRVRMALKFNKMGKSIEYLGCDAETYKIYIESMFEPGMSWDIPGSFQIDHCIPIMYNNPTLEQVIERLHYTNTQPMTAHDNASKGNRYISYVPKFPVDLLPDVPLF